jgi:hypothetical protein
MLPTYYPQIPVISFSCSSFGLYPWPRLWVSIEAAICCTRFRFWSTCRVSCSRSQSSALKTTNAAPARRVTLSGSCLLTTCSTRLLRLSLNLFTLMVSIKSPICTEMPYNYISKALTKRSTIAHAKSAWAVQSGGHHALDWWCVSFRLAAIKSPALVLLK